MKQTLNLKLSQQLTLTPQLQQAIRLLQLSTLELNEEIEIALQENPLLEADDAPIAEAPLSAAEALHEAPVVESEATHDLTPEDNTADSSVQEDFDSLWTDESSFGSGASDDDDFEVQQGSQLNLHEYLHQQVGLLNLSQRDKALIAILIDELDDDGYLQITLDEALGILPEELEVERIELQTALSHLQHLEPTGVGARDLSECLQLQIRNLPPQTPSLSLAEKIVQDFLAFLANKDYNKIKKQLKCDDESLKAAVSLVTHLNPRPGAAYSRDETRYVVPDVIARKVKGQWSASLNRQAMPKLRINQMYANILQQESNGAGQMQVQLQEARWLIKNVQQRFDTILRVSQEIVLRQQQFLEHGEVAMRPLVLRDIAEALELHESTVSRVTNQKYMHTPRGVYELKYFFGSHVETDTGGECSSTAIKALIKQFVSAEDSKKPLSDSHIAELLGGQGIVIARRTVAKYRESLHIPAVAQRKSL